MNALNRPQTAVGPVIDLTPDTDFTKPMRAGLGIVAVALGGFATWAATAPLDSAVVTPGTVIVDTKRKIVQHREGGIVSQIAVKEGDKVEAGAVLATLTDAAAQAQQQGLRTQLDAKLAEQARLVAERDGLEAIAFPDSLIDRANDPKVADILSRETDRFAQRSKTHSGERGILEARIAQLESQRDGRSVLEESKRNQIKLLQDELAGLRELTAKGYYPTNRLRAQERELARMEGEMMSEGAGATQTDKEIGETRLQIMQADQKFRDDVTAELTRVENEANDLTQKLAAAEDSVRRLAVVAPVAGVVQNIKVAGTGAVVAPGGDLMEVIPDQDRLIVEAHVSARDIDRVHVGQEANLRFSAFSSRTTPVVGGEVEVLAADATVDEHTRQSYYTARVEVPADQAARLPRALKAGMPVEVMLEGGSRTPLQYFIKPLMDSFARAFKER